MSSVGKTLQKPKHFAIFASRFAKSALPVILLVGGTTYASLKFVSDEKARTTALYNGKSNKYLETVDCLKARRLDDLKECDYPSSTIVKQLADAYGFSVEQFNNAALHFCPVTMHVTLIERFLNEVAANVNDGNVERINEIFMKHDPKMPFIADLDVMAAFKAKVSKLTRTPDAETTRKMLADIIYPYVVNNWITARYFDNLTHKEGFFGRRLSSEAHAHNIGTRAALWFRDIIQQPNPHRDLQIAPVTNRRSMMEKEAYIQKSSLYERRLLLEQEKKDRRAHLRKPLTEEAKVLLETPGTQTPSPANPPVITIEDADKAVDALKEYGVVIIRGAVSEDQLLALKRQFKCDLESGEEQMDEMKSVEPNAFASRITIGRAHTVFRGTALEPRAVAVQRVWMPIVEKFMGGEKYSYEADKLAKIYKSRMRAAITSNDPDAVEDAEMLIRRPPQDVPVSQRAYCSLMQTVVSDPMALDQSFHVDNAHRGLTVSVALVDINDENGHTHILPGSHKFLDKEENVGYVSHVLSAFKYIWNKGVVDTLGNPDIDLKAGDILIYDSRCFHKGRRNKSWLSRPIMLFRYDFQDTEPPGHSHLIAGLMDMVASSFSFASNVFRQL